MFFGNIVKAGKPQPLVPHPDGYSLHLSQASLSASAKEGTRVSLLIKVGDEEPVVLCTLRAGAQDTVLLDQFLSEYAELLVEGKDSIHITGYYSPQFGSIESGDDDGEDYEMDDFGGHPMKTVFDDGDSDDEDEEGESDEGDETDDEDESEDDILAANHREPSVIIEDVTDKEPQLKALPAPADDGRKRKAEPADDAAAAKKQATEGQQQKQQKQKGQQQQQQQKEQKAADKQQQKQQLKQEQLQPQQQKAKQKEQQKEQKQQQNAKTPEGKTNGSTAAQPVSGKKGVKRYENGFEVHNMKMGDPHGKLAKAGKQVKVRYVGKLMSGKVFDKTGKQPFSFRLGVGQVIKGWDAGVEGMRVGDVRKLVIPPQMAYGSQKTGPIPPNSTLDFEVELVDVK